MIALPAGDLAGEIHPLQPGPAGGAGDAGFIKGGDIAADNLRHGAAAVIERNGKRIRDRPDMFMKTALGEQAGGQNRQQNRAADHKAA